MQVGPSELDHVRRPLVNMTMLRGPLVNVTVLGIPSERDHASGP